MLTVELYGKDGVLPNAYEGSTEIKVIDLAQYSTNSDRSAEWYSNMKGVENKLVWSYLIINGVQMYPGLGKTLHGEATE